MNLNGPVLRQRDGVTCGPTVAVVAGMLLDPRRRAAMVDAEWFAAEQARVQADINRVWPRRLGTTPRGLVRALAAQGVRYRWRFFRGRHDRLADVRSAVADGWPVAMLVGRVIPRHWVLIVAVDGPRFDCFEPTSGHVRAVDIDSVRRARLTGLGFPRAFAYVLPVSCGRD